MEGERGGLELRAAAGKNLCGRERAGLGRGPVFVNLDSGGGDHVKDEGERPKHRTGDQPVFYSKHHNVQKFSHADKVAQPAPSGKAEFVVY